MKWLDTNGTEHFWSRIKQYFTNKIDSVNNELNNSIAVLNARMDTFDSLPAGSTTGNAELTDIRVGYNGATYETAGNSVREQVTELHELNKDVVWSPNLLNHDKDLVNQYMYPDGRIRADDTYYISDYIPVEEGEAYVQVTFSTSSMIFIPRTTGTICYYDINKNFISGFIRNASTAEFTIPSGAKYIRFSSVYNAKRLLDMFGKTSIMSTICKPRELGDWAYIPYGHYIDPINIVRIEEPYVEKGWRGYWYIKFNRIYYVDFDGSKNYLQYNSYMTLKYENLITQFSEMYVKNVTAINEGMCFIYSYRKKLFLIVPFAEVEDNDINIFSVINDVPSGVLYDTFNDNINYFQQKPILNTLPLNVLKEVDTALYESNVLKAPNENIFTFIHVSDNHHVGSHFGKSVDLTGMAIKYLHSRATFDAILNTGDELLTIAQNASGLGYNDSKIGLSNAINAYPIEPLIFCEGNHDRGIIDEQYITHSEYYNLVLRHWNDNPNVHTTYPNSYYYRDFIDKKIRVICLTLYNMSDNLEDSYPYNDYCGYDQQQMLWLCNTALQLNNGWSAIILVHSAPVTTAEGNTGNGDAGNNPLVLRKILESFMNGTNETITHNSTYADGYFNINITTNFGSQGARPLIGVFSGHTHLDRTVKINNINYEAICCGYIDRVEYNGNRGVRTANTISAVCFDIGVVNLTAKTVTLTRVGFVPTDTPTVERIRSWSYK